MMSNDFEEAFSSFLERREYDEAESALFSMVRIASSYSLRSRKLLNASSKSLRIIPVS